jgi:hypothetical protein
MIRLVYIFLLSPTIWSADMGTLLFNGNCATCHHLNKASSAPTIFEVRKRYLKAFPNKKDFIEYMSNWVVKPKKETSLMQDKILKYGLMPELGYDKSTIKEIADYIYKGDIKATTR